MTLTKAARMRYARAVFELAPTTGETGMAYDAMCRVESGADKRSPLRRFAEDLIVRHDQRADQADPPPPGEGHLTCGCMDCQLARAALDAEVSP